MNPMENKRSCVCVKSVPQRTRPLEHAKSSQTLAASDVIWGGDVVE